MSSKASNNNKRPPNRGRPRPRPTTSYGQSAVKNLIMHARDQVTGAVRQRYTGKNAIPHVLRDVSMLMSVVNTEDKHMDNSITFTTVAQGASLVQVLNPPAQGTSALTRVGNSIKINRIQLSMLFKYSSGTGTAYLKQIFKYFLVRWLKTPSSSGTTPFTIGDFLDVDQNSNYTVNSLGDPDTDENFVVMAAGSVNVNLPQALGTDQIVNELVEFDHPCSFHQTFNSTTAASITDGTVFMVFTAAVPANTGGTSSVAFTSRQMFIDN
jgi:hypothetical protein